MQMRLRPPRLRGPTMPPVHPAVIERLAAARADHAESDVLIDAWLRRFRSVVERPLRRTVLREGLEGFDDASLILVLHRLDVRAQAGESDCRWLRTELAVTPSVLAELSYQRRTELYAAARDAGYREVAAKFLGSRRHYASQPAAENPHVELTAGERTAAARTTNRLLLDRLLHDRDPRVITALLDNPRIVERDVVKIAALRPTAPEVLESLASHERWSQNYKVRKALAFNPCSPTPLARGLLRTLLRQDLVALRDSGALAPELRADANLLLAR